jgi:hypothetical protein
MTLIFLNRYCQKMQIPTRNDMRVGIAKNINNRTTKVMFDSIKERFITWN